MMQLFIVFSNESQPVTQHLYLITAIWRGTAVTMGLILQIKTVRSRGAIWPLWLSIRQCVNKKAKIWIHTARCDPSVSFHSTLSSTEDSNIYTQVLSLCHQSELGHHVCQVWNMQLNWGKTFLSHRRTCFWKSEFIQQTKTNTSQPCRPGVQFSRVVSARHS